MVSFQDIQTAYYMVAATGVLVAAAYYVMNIRTTQRNMKQTLETRQTQLFMDYSKRIIAPEFQDTMRELIQKWSWTNFDDFMHKYGPDDNPEAWRRLWEVCYTYEHIGLLVRRELIDPKFLYEFDGPFFIYYWEKFESIWMEYRERYESPPKGEMCEWQEDLYYVLKVIQRENHGDLPSRVARRVALREVMRKQSPMKF
jgi:hypothetical protein